MNASENPRSTIGVAPALLIYLVASICCFGLAVIREPTSRYVAAPFTTADASVYIWSMGWWPYAISHGLNPFYTQLLWAPYGYNLNWGTFIPGLSLIGAPITALYGPIASFNAISLLAPIANACCAFLLCRLFSRRFVSALAGGYLFGFSPYVVGQLLNAHISLSFVACVPLAVALVVQLYQGKLSHGFFLVLMAVVLVVQFLISPETFAAATALGAISFAIVWLFVLPDLRKSLWTAAAYLTLAYAIVAVVLSPILYIMFSRPENISIDNVSYASTIKDLFIPSPLMLISHHRYLLMMNLKKQSPFDYVNFFESGFYLGPVLVLVTYFALEYWHSARGKILICLLSLFWLLCLGLFLNVGAVRVPLPWFIIAKAPLMRYALPSRLGVFPYLVLGIIVAISLDTVRRDWLTGILAALVIVVFLPDIPFTSRVSAKVDTPQFFLSPNHRNALGSGPTLVLPFGMNGNSMIWQADAGFDFAMAGGWTTGAPAGLGNFNAYKTLQDDGLRPSSPELAKTLLSKLRVHTIVMPSEYEDVAAEWSRIVDRPARKVDDVLLINLPSRPQ